MRHNKYGGTKVEDLIALLQQVPTGAYVYFRGYHNNPAKIDGIVFYEGEIQDDFGVDYGEHQPDGKYGIWCLQDPNYFEKSQTVGQGREDEK